MLEVVYSQRAEALLEALADRMAAEAHAPGFSVLAPRPVLVPSRTVEIWLKLELARAAGITANLKTEGFGRFLSGLAEARRPRARLIDREVLEDAVLEVLLDPALLSQPELHPARDYLWAAGDAEAVLDVRRHRLALELAALFEGYLLHRPDLPPKWRERQLFLDDPLFGAIERWERRLFLTIFEAGGVLERRAQRGGCALLPPDKVVEHWPTGLALPACVYVFGFSHLPAAYYRALELMGQRTSVQIFALNPCQAFWEEASAPVGRPLQLWGRAGRENVRALGQLVPQADERFVEATLEPTTLLAQLQQDILRGEPDLNPEPDRWRSDRSIRVLAAPGVRREVEVVAEEIWRLVRERSPEHEPLRFNQIAVLLAERDDRAYAAQVSAVFREADDIPFSMIDLPLSTESRVIEAVELLLELPLGRFRRSELLRLLTHPAVIARYPDADPNEWVHWCDVLGILHGADRTDHAGTYIERDLYNWDQGLRRLALGVFMSGGRDERAPAYEAAGQHYLPEEIPPGRAASAAQLSLLARSLVADARLCAESRLTAKAWTELFELLLTTYIIPTDEPDRRALSRCLRVIAGLSERDVGPRPLSYRAMRELVRSALAGLTGARGQHLAEGVVVAPLAPMRAVPFKVIFVLGLGAARFPASDRRSPLDLRRAQPRATDIDAVDRDRFTFLETILSARERLYLSFEAKDALTGEVFEPSVVVRELLEHLDAGYLAPGNAARWLIETPPLRRFEARGIEPVAQGYQLPGARAERLAERLGAELEVELHRPALAGDLLHLDAAREERLRGLLRLPLLPPLASVTEETGAVISVSLTRIRQFLECPLQGSARAVLRLEDEDADPYASEDEAFVTSAARRTASLRRAFWRGLAQAGGSSSDRALAFRQIREAYRGERERLELSGQSPIGIFARVEVDEHERILSGWLEQLAKLPANSGVSLPFAFGRAEEVADVGQVFEPLRLEVDVVGANGVVLKRKVEVIGQTESLLLDPWTSLTLSPRKASDKDTHRELRDALRGFLDHVMLSATERRNSKHRVVVLSLRAPMPRFFPALSAEAARRYLARVIGALLSGVHTYLWPFEAVARLREGKRSHRAIADEIRRDLERRASPYATQWGPVPRPERFPPPSEVEAAEIFRQRYALFFGEEEPT